jgi:crotonobetainyl-CoA:carnitine CoA-transferase CaiB-like acyl-CoA transferase
MPTTPPSPLHTASSRSPRPRSGPLAGIRILDFGWVAVGPLATRLLADMGAEVIKVEHKNRLDLTRRLPVYKDQPPRPFSDEDAHPDPDKSGLFNNYNRNKLGVTLDMAKPEARAIVDLLIARSDVVSENFAPGVMERWGLTYQHMHQIRENIIFVRMSGFGHSGPYRDYKSYGPIAQAVSGLTHMSGLPGREPSGIGFAYMDNMTGYFGTSAILMALIHRMNTGEGLEFSLSGMEVGVNLLGPALLEAVASGRGTRRADFPVGNLHPVGAASPHGVYPCDAEDSWCALAVFGDEQWSQFRVALGSPSWAGTPSFQTHEMRLANHDALDSEIESWTRQRSPHEVMHNLQSHGIAAAAVQTTAELQEADPQLAERGTFVELDHPVAGSALFEGVPVHFSSTPPDHWRSSPMLGEDNTYVLENVLGISTDRVTELREQGVI